MTAATMNQFKLMFPQSQIERLADRYQFEDDGKALRAGAQIRKGQYTRSNLLAIFDWKTKGRGRSRLYKNTDQEIADSLALVFAAKTDRAAVAVLLGLNGVQVPVASAVLTAIDPQRFTIVDFRALEALNVKRPNITIDFFLAYLNECRKLARQNKVSFLVRNRCVLPARLVRLGC
jgi:hypothetical protein